uniref:Uncharacterized protein n=1 Tax=Salix viminalis TaxID=40686 RepID=A0A6N2L377_SALVM
MNSFAWRSDLNIISGLLVPETILLRCYSAKPYSLFSTMQQAKDVGKCCRAWDLPARAVPNVMVSMKPLQTIRRQNMRRALEKNANCWFFAVPRDFFSFPRLRFDD